MDAALNLRLTRTLPRRSMRRLVVPLLGGDDARQIDGLLPVRRAAAAYPGMSGGHWASKDGSESSSAKRKAIVPSHGRSIPGKIKYAIRKIELASIYALRIFRVSANSNTK